MKTVIRVVAHESRYCDACTQKATRHIVIGKEREHYINAASIFLCEDCAKKLAQKLERKREIPWDVEGPEDDED